MRGRRRGSSDACAGTGVGLGHGLRGLWFGFASGVSVMEALNRPISCAGGGYGLNMRV